MYIKIIKACIQCNSSKTLTEDEGIEYSVPIHGNVQIPTTLPNISMFFIHKIWILSHSNTILSFLVLFIHIPWSYVASWKVREDTMDRVGGTNRSEWRKIHNDVTKLLFINKSVTTQRYANREDSRLDTSEYIIIHSVNYQHEKCIRSRRPTHNGQQCTRV